MARPRFEIGDEDFLLDDEPHRILSGSIHYFRVHPEQWRDRIRKARLMGLNTIETYVAWNAHSPRRGEFRTDGGLDLGRFLDEIHDEGMHAIVRPGPYICAEWHNGGLPGWLFRSGAEVRRSDPRFLEAVREYYQSLEPILTPRQIDEGGPIVLVQVENEYGAYGSDKQYLAEIAEITRGIGIRVPLTTIDQPTDRMLRDGSLPGLHLTGSFGSRSPERLATLRQHQPTGPLMCAEYWDGWFDGWGEHHHVTDATAAARDLDALLATGASVNLYMFHGGTNFGATNGANDKGVYVADVTSYDYDAPLDEAGRTTEKYWAFREVIGRYTTLPEAPPSLREAPSAPAFEVVLDRACSLWHVLDDLSDSVDADRLPFIDDLEQYGGFSVYRALDEVAAGVLEFAEVRDRAQVFVDRMPVGTLARDHRERRIDLGRPGMLEILVEDQGRVNYGPRLGEPTGLIAPATLDGAPLRRWRLSALRSERVAATALDRAVPHDRTTIAGPSLLVGTFDSPDAVSDHFLDTADWGRGMVWINGFALGRYWSRGPQRTLFVPAPVLRGSGNEIVVLELHAAPALARFSARHDLGPIDW